MARPAILVLATPYVYASMIAHAVTRGGHYDVVVLDLASEELPGSTPFAGAITSVPVDRTCADVVIELPDSFDEPVIVRLGEMSVAEPVDPEHPLDDVVRLLDRYVQSPARP